MLRERKVNKERTPAPDERVRLHQPAAPAAYLNNEMHPSGEFGRFQVDSHREHFELVVSEAVIAECSAGDLEAAAERAVFLTDLPILEITLECKTLAAQIMKKASLPEKADVDALHIAVAALNGVDYLLTWNCKHIANPSLRRIIESVLFDANIEPPVICTPQEIINVQ